MSGETACYNGRSRCTGNMRYILSRDSGGTKCSAMLVREDGVLLGSGECDVADPESGRSAGGSGRSPESVRAASLRALGNFRCDELVIVGDVDDSNEYADFASIVSHAYVSESQAALALAGERCGIVVLAGTGAFVYGETWDGWKCHLDSLGPIVGDYGSGYYIGHLALRAAARSGWAKRHRTSLREAIYAACGADMTTERRSGFGLATFSLMNPDRAEMHPSHKSSTVRQRLGTALQWRY